MTVFQKVEGQPNLVRDLRSNAVLNRDNSQLRAYREARRSRMSEKERLAAVEREVADIHDKLDRVLGILTTKTSIGGRP